MQWIVLLLAVVTLVLLIALLLRPSGGPQNATTPLREELWAARGEASQAAMESRKELSGALRTVNETLSATLAGIGQVQQAQLDGMTKQLGALTQSNQTSLAEIRGHRRCPCAGATRGQRAQAGRDASHGRREAAEHPREASR